MVYLYLTFIAMLLIGCVHAEQSGPDLSTRLDKPIKSLESAHEGATVAAVVRDSSGEIVYERNSDRVYHAASTMKIPVMIEVYRQAAEGRFSLDDELPVVNAFRSIVDGSIYSIGDDTDDAIYQRLGRQMPIRDLVYQMITVSSNLATNLLIDLVAADSVQFTAERLGVKRMQVLRGVEDLKAFDLGMSNTATAADLAVLLEALLQGRAVSREADRQMMDILLQQRLNEMIPAGLPDGVSVAHKTGGITKIHHDAGIVFPPEGAPYILVILIEGIEDKAASGALGAEISRRVFDTLAAGA